MEDLRSGIEHLKQAKVHMSEANGIISDCISKLKALEEENAELKAKYTPKPSSVRHYKYAKPDSWAKLEEDAKKTACNYALAPRDEDGLTTCNGCRFEKSESCHHEMVLDVFERAKKLAGIEEEAQ